MSAAVQSRQSGHQLALRLSSGLTQYWRRTQRPMAAKVTPERVVRVLHQVGVRPVLMGTYGLVGWRSEPRATLDVDVLVRKRDVRKAVKAIKEAFSTLVPEDTPVVTRFRDPAIDKVVIDLMKPTQGVFQMVFRYVIRIDEMHDIPDLEMALVSKFAAMTSPRRAAERKMTDGGDFIDIVKHNRKAIDMPKLRRLAGRVYADGGAEIQGMIKDIDAGKTIQM